MSQEPTQPLYRVQPVDLEEEMRRSYLDYAMSVIVGRAIPDVRDGLKPVHRRILYSMYKEGVRPDRPYKKSARVVGDVLGKYHPHGDAAVYDALVRMAQPFSMRYPLVDGQGNFGSLDGDPPAAMRYTEVRMARLAMELLADIDKDTVDFRPNFDGSEQEPEVLPTRVPNLLINGSGGIAVGMATNIPPHNLVEVVDATVRLVRDPSLSVEQLMRNDPETGRRGIRGPDFPTGAYVCDAAGLTEVYARGRGRIVMRAKAEVVQREDGRDQIVVTEIPYQVNKADLLRRIAELARSPRGQSARAGGARHVEGIAEVRDESDRHGLRIVVELRKGADGHRVLQQLYRYTNLQCTFGMNLLAIVEGRPRTLNLKEALLAFVQHRRQVVVRRTRYELREAERQRELVLGLGMAVTEVDAVVSTIRQSRDPDEALQRLQRLPLRGLEAFLLRAGRPEHELREARERGDFFLNERQAKAILQMRLQRLTGLEREKLAAEYGSLCERIAELRAILDDEGKLLDLIVQELDEIKARYGDERRTELLDEGPAALSDEDLVADEDTVVTLTARGYVKRTRLDDYRQQHRGGKGRLGAKTLDDDFVQQLFVAGAHASVLFWTNQGRVFQRKVYEIPEAAAASRGKHVANLLQLGDGEQVVAMLPVRDFDEADAYVLTATERGRVKRTALREYANVTRAGKVGVGIAPGDALLGARVVRSGEHVLLGTSEGRAIRFAIEDVRPMGRTAAGVRGVELRGEARVVSMDTVDPSDTEAQVLTVSERGYAKRTPLEQWPKRGRGGLGVLAMSISDKTGGLARLRVVHPDDGLIVITERGQLLRTSVREVRLAGRATQGVRLIHVADGDRVVDVAVGAEDTEETDGPGPASEPPLEPQASPPSEPPAPQDGGGAPPPTGGDAA